MNKCRHINPKRTTNNSLCINDIKSHILAHQMASRDELLDSSFMIMPRHCIL